MLSFRDEACTAVIIASGPSVASCDLDRCRRYPTIVVNDCYRLAPWAEALYACDPEWWDLHHARVRETFGGSLWTQTRQAAEKYALNLIEGRDRPGLSLDPKVIHQNRNSGAQAINLATLWGARRLLLLGFDMRRDPGKPSHWFGDHPGTMNKPSDYTVWIRLFDAIARDLKDMGVEVINCSMVSALTQFPKKPLEAVCPSPTV